MTTFNIKISGAVKIDGVTSIEAVETLKDYLKDYLDISKFIFEIEDDFINDEQLLIDFK